MGNHKQPGTLDKAAINIFIFWLGVKLAKKLFNLPSTPFVTVNFTSDKKEENKKEAEDVIMDVIDGVYNETKKC